MDFLKLHKESFVLDSHCDTPSMLIEGVDLGKRLDRGQVDYIRMKEGGVDGAFFAVYTPASFSYPQSNVRAIELLSKIYDSVDKNKDKVAIALSVQEARRNKEKDLISIFIGMENGSPIGTDLAMLRFFYRMGVRYMTLCHSQHNEICDSCAPTLQRWGGVSSFGKQVIEEMNKIGMLIDVSHISDESFYDVLKYSRKPVVATHSCCRSLCPHPRNMTDMMIKDLAAADGVIQINFYPAFLDPTFTTDSYIQLADELDDRQREYREELWNEEKQKSYFDLAKRMMEYPAPSFKLIVDHIDYAVKIAGVKHVGLGSDFDGIATPPDGLRDISMFGRITEELLTRGYSNSEIRGILGENFLRVMEEVAS